MLKRGKKGENEPIICSFMCIGSEKLSHCELLAIDEAAAIPLPMVKQLLGPYLVFLSSTVNGYEGTGRALSLKLIDQLRKQQGKSDNY